MQVSILEHVDIFGGSLESEVKNLIFFHDFKMKFL